MAIIKKVFLLLTLFIFVFSTLVSPVNANPLAGRIVASTVGKQILKGIAEKGGLKVADDSLDGMTAVLNKKAFKDMNPKAQSLVDEIHRAEQNLKPTSNSNWKKYVLDPMLWLTGMDIVLEIYNAVKNGEDQEGLVDSNPDFLGFVPGTYCDFEDTISSSDPLNLYFRYYDSSNNIKVNSETLGYYKNTENNSYCVVNSSWWESKSILYFDISAYINHVNVLNKTTYMVFIGGHSSYYDPTYSINKPFINTSGMTYISVPRIEKALQNNDPSNLPPQITIIVPDDPNDKTYVNEPIQEESDPDDLYEDNDPTVPDEEEPNGPEPDDEKPAGSSWWKWLFDLLLAPINLILDLIQGLFDLLGGLVSALLDGLKALLIPSDDFFKNMFTDFKSLFDTKLPLIPQLQEFFSSIKDTTVDSKKPKFEVTFPENWGGDTYSIIDFTFYDEYRAWILNFIRFIAWFVFLKKLYQRIPKIIY